MNAVALPGVFLGFVGLLGVGVGAGLARLAASRPWGTAAPDPARRRGPAPTATAPLALGTGLLFALTAWRFGASWELPAFLVFAAAGVLLSVLDLRHRLLPNRVVLPAIVAGDLLLSAAAAATGAWTALLRAGASAAVLFVVFLVLALISPRSLGMGDVKLAALIGLYLGWLSWDAVVVGAAAGFVVQALVALLLLAARRIGLRSELPFGPAMLAGAALTIGAGDLLQQ